MNRTVVLHFSTYSPYLLARLKACQELNTLNVIGLEATERNHASQTFFDTSADARAAVRLRTACPGQAYLEVPTRTLWAALHRGLDELNPAAVAVPAWSTRSTLAILSWCLKRGRPAITMSDSMYSDKPRVFWVEAVKRRVVRCFASAVVGSAAQREYLSCLGMRLDQTVLGYNVIDNSYFSAGAAAARQDADAVRNALKLPQDYFLASGRFIPVKNLFGLLSEYALYLQSPADKKAKLAIIGDGPLRHALTERIQELNLAGHVFLLGKKTYAELPALYALARAFVLASTKETWGLVVNEAMASGLPVIVSDRCGCAPHLVSPGVNGFIFSPSKRGDLAARLADLSKDSAAVARMGQQSQAIIASWSPELFATALEEAFRLALSEPRFRGGWADRLLLSALSRRKEGEPE